MTGPLRSGLISALRNTSTGSTRLGVTLTDAEQVAAVDAILRALEAQGVRTDRPDPDRPSCPDGCPLAGATEADPDDLPEHDGRVGQLTVWEAPTGQPVRPYATTYWTFTEGSEAD